ncbi:replication stress response regulator SDE2 [Oncorhynchus mykiss]|uniref:Replication stress response regulator SDE2 n=1 Tax=Oncorhynchus mykiss TaxID=8022 RepID=A0A8C7QLV3_ONCMY|nr:replication stress response regulator SDE2 [Oncorhynchus mykiss]XP_021424000.1 replication stress response regulator SDE2 [Oncorhynchus mykiss]
MELFLSGPLLHFCKASFPTGASVRDLVDIFTKEKGIPSSDLYVKNNGRLSELDEKLQAGAVYRLEPRLCGGKGGFGSMLRALGAQIEKTTNREACRDLSGRRLRDVNHEKEMAEWLKKQADREAEKEQRRLERLQRKLAEPKHHFTDPEYEKQCHDLSERLEDSVLKGMQASSSGLVKVDEAPKRKKSPPNKGQGKSKKKCFWTGVGGLDDLDSSEDDNDASDSGNSPSTSSSGSGVPDCPVTGATSAHTSASQSRAEQTATPEAPRASSSSISGPSSPESPAEVQTQSQAEAAAFATGGSGEQKEVVPTEETFPKTDNLSAAQSNVNQAACEDGPLDLQAVHSDKELETLGLDRLKAELIARGMKCGGTLSERAARLFSTVGLSAEDIDPALLAKPSKKQ